MKILLFAVFYCTLFFTSQANAKISDYKTATWNLQGSSSSTESKWNINVRQLISGALGRRIQILAIQEAGNVPLSASLMPQIGTTQSGVLFTNPNQLAIPVNEYRWNLGTAGRADNRYIYFARNDSGANRVNVSIVTDRRVDEVIILPPTNNYNGARPILGVRIGSDYFFNIHASANGGVNAPLTIHNLSNYFTGIHNYPAQWMLMGDFNRSPSNLMSALHTQYPILAQSIRPVYQPHPTHQGGGNYDFAVVGGLSPSLALVAARLIAALGNQISSDHLPIRFYRGG